ncbi:unnamed protein product [Ilex paraguariensis]|uniref:Uncharacterized protein n=1 Tax=Ilex paraguariensis TaxID=185542 RepID=A0ABC8U8V9_9AQUA
MVFIDQGFTLQIGNVSRMQSLNLKRKLSDKEAYQMQLHKEKELVKPSSTGSTTLVGPNPFKGTAECVAPLLPLSGGNCTESISGIDSKLEPLLRGSNRKMLESSAMNSSTASFSDRPLVGSQERGAFSVSASAKLAERKTDPQQTISRLTDEAMVVRYNENHAVGAENNVRSSPSIDAVGMTAHNNNKRKRILDAVESVEHLYAEGQKWYLQISENLSRLHGMLNSQMMNDLEGERPMELNLEHNLYDKLDRSRKKRKASSKEKEASWHLDNTGEHMKRLGIKEVNVCTEAFPPAYNVKGTAQACRDATADPLRSSQKISGSFDEIVNGDYMKMLDLDSIVLEECYRIAIKTPLSPTIPEIELQSIETLEMENTMPLVDESSYEGNINVKDKLVPCCSLDVINREIDSSDLEFNTSSTAHIPSLQKNEIFFDSFENVGNNENGNSSTAYTGNTCIRQFWDSRAELEMPNVSISGNEGSIALCENRPLFTQHDLLKFYFVFPDRNDGGSISKIFHAMRSCMSQCFMLSQTDWLVRNILMALLKVEDLSPR